jgi:ankyrin repeat protein
MNNALHYAVWGGNINTVRFIMDTCKIDASIPNKEGLLPVQLAAASNNVELVSLLNDSTDSRSASGYTSLHRACMYGALETVVSLSRDARVDVFAKTNTDQSALHLAAKGGYFAVVKYLVDEASLDINATDEFQLTPLHVACYGYVLLTTV